MALDFIKLKFRFQEDLALRNSLYSIAAFALEYAVTVSGANSAVFLYASPGNDVFEKVATLGLSKEEDLEWSHCKRHQKSPLPESIRSQKVIEVKAGQNTGLLAFPLKDSDVTCAGFSISFQTPKFIAPDTREFLAWIAHLTEKAIFVNSGEGV